MLEKVAYGLMFIGLLTIALIPIDTKKNEKIKYCHINSTFVLPSTEFIPEMVHKYKTDCGIVFSSKKEYRLGDSIKVKTIIVE